MRGIIQVMAVGRVGEDSWKVAPCLCFRQWHAGLGYLPRRSRVDIQIVVIKWIVAARISPPFRNIVCRPRSYRSRHEFQSRARQSECRFPLYLRQGATQRAQRAFESHAHMHAYGSAQMHICICAHIQMDMYADTGICIIA